MRSSIRPGSRYNNFLLLFCIAFILFLTIAASIRFSTPVPGIPSAKAEHLDSGWSYEYRGNLYALDQFPCTLDLSDSTLHLMHSLSDMQWNDKDVLAFQTRYESIRVWADDVLVYEAAKGKEHALSSMWHFIPLYLCEDSSTLYVELTRYDQKTNWSLPSVLMDHPDAIWIHLLSSHAPAILFWISCMLFTLLLILVIIFMAIRKMENIAPILALAAFIFLSGQWILLDSKVTTLFGGNYALTYFFSYCVFYLLPAPFFFHIQLIFDQENRVLRYLSFAILLNAAICMGLHLFGVVSIRNTTFTVHILILLATFVSVRGFFHSIVKRRERKLICTFLGVLFIFISGLISIVLYYTNLLPPTNSAILYSWALLVMTVCMTMDTVSSLGYFWKQKQYMDRYRQLAVQDSMTMLENRNAYESRLKDLTANPPNRLTFILFDVDNLKKINDTYGHHVGDQAIYLSAQCVREIFNSLGNCYRIGGDELCVIVTSPCDTVRKLQQFDDLLKLKSNDTLPITVSHGFAESSFEPGRKITATDITELQKAADKKLYEYKNSRKQSRQV